MTTRILVVDDVLPNIKLLEARLSAEYFRCAPRDERARGLVDLCP